MKNVKNIALSLVLASSLANAAGFGAVEFEPKKDRAEFEKIDVKFDVDVAFYYQSLDQTFNPTTETKQPIQPGLALPTADLDINARIMKGMNVKLETMLSSHHHNETYVKGGWASIDSLDFIEPGFAKGFMDQATIKVGVNDINFGDAHFRRTDNADVFRNPFIMNMGVESYMQAGFVELMYRLPSINSFVNFGISNGQVNPDDVKDDDDGSDAYAYYGKFAYDKQYNDSLRVRVSQSVFYTNDSTKNSLYSGDKAGTVSREVFNNKSSANPFGSPEAGTRGNDFGSIWKAVVYRDITASMTNVFVKYENTEFFGLLEMTDGNGSAGSQELLHYSADVIQRFGKNNRFYVAARYENATTEMQGDSTDDELTQIQATLGWYLSENALVKAEYISQKRENFEYVNSTAVTGDSKFDGFMISAALSF